MATIITDEIREELMSKGIWGDFVRRREDARMGDGLGSTASSRKVLDEMVAEGLVPEEIVAKLRPRGRPSAKAKAKDCEIQKQCEAKEEAVSLRASEKPSAKVSLETRKPVVDFVITKDTFAGKKASFKASFLWAFANLSVCDVTPDDAPSAEAWELRKRMNMSPSLMTDLLKAGLGAAMRKSEEEDRSGERFDGEGEYDLLGKIAGVV